MNPENFKDTNTSCSRSSAEADDEYIQALLELTSWVQPFKYKLFKLYTENPTLS